MPIILNGTGTISGLTAGGLPDGVITTAELAPGAGGKILQVVQSVKSDQAILNSTSMTDITGLSASITPASTANKVLVLVDFKYGGVGSGAALNLVRGSTNLYQGSGANSRPAYTHFLYGWVDTGAAYYGCSSEMISFLDSPSATSSTTYKIQCANINNTYPLYINYPAYDASAYKASVASSITLLEVAA
jgi:hypothetical protein